MARITKTLAVTALAAAALFAAHGNASAQTRFCPTRESFFGTIQQRNGNTLIVRTPSGGSGTVVLQPQTTVNAHGYALRPGTYVGAYGCVTPNGVFHASELTLASDASLYQTQISGVVERIAGNRLWVREPARRTTGIWYVPDIDDFRVGQTVTGTGMMAANGEFYPQRINNASTAYVPEYNESSSRPSITLSGVVRRVMPGALMVWEPSRGTTGRWIVRNAQAFRVGENVVATGTENRRGDFYPYSVHIARM